MQSEYDDTLEGATNLNMTVIILSESNELTYEDLILSINAKSCGKGSIWTSKKCKKSRVF